MRKLLVVPMLMLYAVAAQAGTGLVILDVMPRSGLWQNMVEYALLLGRTGFHFGI